MCVSRFHSCEDRGNFGVTVTILRSFHVEFLPDQLTPSTLPPKCERSTAVSVDEDHEVHHGKDAVVSALVRYKHPSEHIRRKWPNRDANMRLGDMKIV